MVWQSAGCLRNRRLSIDFTILRLTSLINLMSGADERDKVTSSHSFSLGVVVISWCSLGWNDLDWVLFLCLWPAGGSWNLTVSIRCLWAVLKARLQVPWWEGAAYITICICIYSVYVYIGVCVRMYIFHPLKLKYNYTLSFTFSSSLSFLCTPIVLSLKLMPPFL